ncbi:hypothetical protein GCM10009332_10730 [Shewanella gelidii]|uniref:Uncharacterized protein n=1 Tax=Shewanella gelidii TaxID=1642821 RepID=A0A917JNJ8_9GAMM|nr:hypothetical protein GCM10009332_10730 [Shewanella gelidii]
MLYNNELAIIGTFPNHTSANKKKPTTTSKGIVRPSSQNSRSFPVKKYIIGLLINATIPIS